MIEEIISAGCTYFIYRGLLNFSPCVLNGRALKSGARFNLLKMLSYIKRSGSGTLKSKVCMSKLLERKFRRSTFRNTIPALQNYKLDFIGRRWKEVAPCYFFCPTHPSLFSFFVNLILKGNIKFFLVIYYGLI